MIAKLYKVENTFYLKVGETILGTSSNPNLSASIRYSLSLKNCEAIELGYDLDELFNKVDSSIDYHEFDFTSFKHGANAILEILGDKKFTKEDMSTMMLKSAEWVNDGGEIDANKLLNDTIQSLQQTEWDVEVEMECVMGCQNLILNGENSVCCGDKKPKLDENGCIILKRIKE